MTKVEVVDISLKHVGETIAFEYWSPEHGRYKTDKCVLKDFRTVDGPNGGISINNGAYFIQRDRSVSIVHTFNVELDDEDVKNLQGLIEHYSRVITIKDNKLYDNAYKTFNKVWNGRIG